MMVFIFHCYSRWAPPENGENLYLWNTNKIVSFISSFGYLGVHLFFMISGFVIHMTLTRKSNISQFYFARIRRIYPASIICVSLIFLIKKISGTNFQLNRPIDLIPSLLLISPEFIKVTLGIDTRWITGVLWSLFVEIQFYALVGVIFYKIRKYKFEQKLFILSIISTFFKVGYVLTSISVFKYIDELFPLINYIWYFTAGVLFYDIYVKDSRSNYSAKVKIFFTLLYLLATIQLHDFATIKSIANCAIILVYFLVFGYISKNRHGNQKRVTIFSKIGDLSFEIYLIHESFCMIVFSLIHQKEGNTILMASPILFLVLIIFLSKKLQIFTDFVTSYSLNKFLRPKLT